MGSKVALFLIKVYQYLSKFFPGVCRFSPTCSEYTKLAIEKHGLIRGSWLGIKRILRCRPGASGGFDPLP